MKAWTISQIREAMKLRGSHWWDRETVTFFGTRIEGKTYTGNGEVFFVTSETPSRGKRKCSVRCFNVEECTISTVGDFCSISRDDAIELARESAKRSRKR